MIDAISGRVARRGADYMVIDTGAIAYRVFCPTRTLTNYQERDEILIYTHLSLHDDEIKLYGFSSLQERKMFRALLPVSKIGPRLALQLLCSLSPQEFMQAVEKGDIDRLSQVKGIGRKTAQRILVELRGRLGTALETALPLSEKEKTALKALTSKSLGFSATEARRAVEALRGEDLPVEELVRRAIQTIGT